MLREKIAGRIIVACGVGTEYPCPHTPEGNPFGTSEMCQHEDRDICLWQFEQADGILSALREEIEKVDIDDPDPHSWDGEWEGLIAGKEAARQAILAALDK